MKRAELSLPYSFATTAALPPHGAEMAFRPLPPFSFLRLSPQEKEFRNQSRKGEAFPHFAAAELPIRHPSAFILLYFTHSSAISVSTFTGTVFTYSSPAAHIARSTFSATS